MNGIGRFWPLALLFEAKFHQKGAVERKIIRPFTMDQELQNFFKSFTQLALRLGLIRGLTSLIPKFNRVDIFARPQS